MLTIRAAQMKYFEEHANAILANQVAGFLAEQHPETTETLSRDVLLKRIRWGIRQAQKFHFSTGAEVAVFVSYLFTEGPAFPSHPVVEEILESKADRINCLLDLSQYTWELIREHAQDGRWPAES